MKIALLILALITAVAGIAAAAVRYATEPLTWHQAFGAEGCCIDITHAGGTLDGEPYTNSLEALRQNYRAGRRIFEIDLSLTADGRIVLAHDWNAYGGVAPDSSEFLKQGPLTRLDLDGFLAWLRLECAGCRVVTDAKFDFVHFRDAFFHRVPVPESRARFILQTYDFETLHALAELDPEQPQILTLYRVKEVPDEELSRIAQVPGLLAVTMPIDRVPLQAASTIEATGKPVFTHGYPWMMQSELILRTARLFGVSGFYKD